MNITDQVAEQIGGDLEVFIKATPFIQFYANSNLDVYQWRDSRFTETSDVWCNTMPETRQELIEEIKKHLKSKDLL
jgi:hypothetical protein